MSQNDYTILGNDIKVGIDGVRVPWGLVLNTSGDKSGSLDEYPGESGETETVIKWNRRETISLEILRGGFKDAQVSTLPEPEFGDIIEYRQKKWIVDKVQPKEELGKATKYSISLLHLPKLALPETPAQAASASGTETPIEDAEFPPAE